MRRAGLISNKVIILFYYLVFSIYYLYIDQLVQSELKTRDLDRKTLIKIISTTFNQD